MMEFLLNKNVNFNKINRITRISIFHNDILSNVFEKICDSKNFKMIYFNIFIILNSSEMAKSIWFKV